MKQKIKARITQDIKALSLLNMLPHVAVIFTLISGAQFTSTTYWIAKGANLDPQDMPNFERIFCISSNAADNYLIQIKEAASSGGQRDRIQ